MMKSKPRTKKLTKPEVTTIKARIKSILNTHASVAPSRTLKLLPISSLQGKLYEADVLSQICKNLAQKEKLNIVLIGGRELRLRQKGGAIDRKRYPYFKVNNGSKIIGDLFTDVYFNTLSYHSKGSSLPQTRGDYHELDIALVDSKAIDYPKFDEILLAVECKNTTIKKSIIRELLGFRRELSFLHHPSATKFSTWPINQVNANPSSVHMLYCSDIKVNDFKSNCLEFGIILEHYKM
jgi:hypothetical protein